MKHRGDMGETMSRTIAGFDGSQSRIKRRGKLDRIGFWIKGPSIDMKTTKKLTQGTRTVEQVEMIALQHLCETLSQIGISDAIIQGDSKRVIDSVLHAPINGDQLLRKCKQYFQKNPHWILYWVKREHNSLADIIAKNCIS